MGQHRQVLAPLAAIMVAALCAACGAPLPLATPIETTSPLPTPLPAATQTPAGGTTPTVSAIPTQTAGPSPTPNMEATSASVYATITALAATPTYPPTSTPRPRRTPIGAGPENGDVPPTALYVSGGIAVQMISRQVVPGGAATLTIRSQPGAVCTVQIDRSTATETRTAPIRGATAQVAGSDGVAAWVWSVDATEPAGIMRLIVDCGAAGKARLQMEVTK